MSSELLSTPEADNRARKRTAIGLAPVRPTAKDAPLRPPGEAPPVRGAWLATSLVILLLVITLVLVISQFWGQTPNLSVPTTTFNFPAQTTPAPAATALIVSNDFTDGDEIQLVLPNQQDGLWSLRSDSAEGIYRMEVQPNQLAWSTIVGKPVDQFRIEAGLTIGDIAPEGYAGFISRYQDNKNFYLFAIDGQGRFQIQLLSNGDLQTIQPWTESAALKLAGNPNTLAIEENGAMLRFFANGQLLAEITSPQLSLGDVGIFAAAPSTTIAEVSFDWLRLFAL